MEDIEDLCEMDFEVLNARDVYLTACELSSKLSHHLFDTLYHAVALNLPDAILITADKQYYHEAESMGHKSSISRPDAALVSLNPDPTVSGWLPYAKDRNPMGGTSFHRFAGANRELPEMMKALYPEPDLEVLGTCTAPTSCTQSPDIKNDVVLFDNRIPAADFTNAEYASAGARFIAYTENPDGSWAPAPSTTRFADGVNYDASPTASVHRPRRWASMPEPSSTGRPTAENSWTT